MKKENTTLKSIFYRSVTTESDLFLIDNSPTMFNKLVSSGAVAGNTDYKQWSEIMESKNKIQKENIGSGFAVRHVFIDDENERRVRKQIESKEGFVGWL